MATDLLHATLRELAPARLLTRQLAWNGDRLRLIGEPAMIPGRPGGPLEASFELARYRSRLVLALGKAAAPMLLAWRELIASCDQNPDIRRDQNPDARWQSIVISPGPMLADYGPEAAATRQFIGGHPAPNEASRAGAEAMLAAIRGLTAPALVVYLISGGGSALAESPLDPAWRLADVQTLYRQLVLCGAPIGEINTLRKHLSSFKGGRLAAAAGQLGREAAHGPSAKFDIDQLSLLISDVPPGDAGSISSGPSLPDATTAEDCYRICAARRLRLPAPMAELLEARRLPETPKPGDATFSRAHWRVIGDNHLACETLARLARAAGFEPVVDHAADEEDYLSAAEYLLARWRQLRRRSPRACLIAGGEVRVAVPDAAGRGGRNQAFALACARALLPDEAGCIASLGTDGQDGNSPAAGAIVDVTTPARARHAGYEIERALAEFDAYPLLAAIGDSLDTGATGNNLRDLRLFI